MNDPEEYMKLPYRMEIIPDADEGGYVVSFPELPGCITTGETIEEAVRNAEDAKIAWINAAIEDGIIINKPIVSYSGQFKLRIPRSLHRELVEQARAEGISLNQYCVYLLSRNSAQKS